jgi:hypothetical protein
VGDGERRAARLKNVHWQAQHMADKRHDRRPWHDHDNRRREWSGPGYTKGRAGIKVRTTALPVLVVHDGKVDESRLTWELQGPGTWLHRNS